jgi:hypothetical protein
LVYVYYDSVTKQVSGIFDTPYLAEQKGWSTLGLSMALVPDGMGLDSVDFKIDQVTTQDGLQVVERYSISAHPSSSADSA